MVATEEKLLQVFPKNETNLAMHSCVCISGTANQHPAQHDWVEQTLVQL